MSKRSGPTSYESFKGAAPGTPGDDHYQKTVARIAKIQSHFSDSPKSARLKDKVCIITGVGSLKGIGYEYTYNSSTSYHAYDCGASRRASALLFACEGKNS